MGDTSLGVVSRSSALIGYYGFWGIIEDTPLGVFGGCWGVLLFLIVACGGLIETCLLERYMAKFSTCVAGLENKDNFANRCIMIKKKNVL